VGQLDQRRLASITAGVLQSVSQHRAHTVIFDITGVPTVDAVVGHALVDASQAVRLLGSRVMLSGVRPGVAMTLSQLGVDLSGVAPVADLRNALSA
jgi:rsbT co-antagonist protein RsbR